MWNPLGVAGYGSDSDSDSEPELANVSAPSKPIEQADNTTKHEELSSSAPVPTPVEPIKQTNRLTLPDLPRKPCAPATQAKIDNLRDKKEFDNPYILAKVVDYFGIEEMQSNFTKEVFDPYGYNLDDYYDKLNMALQKEQERRAMLVQQNPALRWTQPNPLLQ
ncbi:SAP30-binding protein [Aphanomyces cochlioides]|nr:SAP30-binding protein [Aphanomyces cochlioides]